MDIEAGENQTRYVGFDDQSQFEDDPVNNDEYLDDIPPWTFTEIAVAGLAAVTVGVSIGAMAIAYNPFVLAVGVFGLLVPPYTALQEQKMTDIKAMEETNKAMEREVANLSYENERLAGENKKLEKSVDSLHDLTVVFEEIREMEDVSLDVLEEQLKERQQMLAKMEEDKLATVLDNIFSILVASDENGDNFLSDDELDVMIKCIEGINKVQIDDAKAKKLIRDTGGSFKSVMKLIKNLLDNDPNTGPEDKIITFL